MWLTKWLKYAYLAPKNVGIKGLIFKKFRRKKNLKEFKISKLLWVTKGLKYVYFGAKKVGIKELIF